MTRCDFCGRAILPSNMTLTPYFFPHGPLCARSRCREMARDALKAQLKARDQYDELAAAIAARRKEQVAPVGYRGDEMVRIDLEEPGTWVGNQWAKSQVVSDE